jgi:hypothetical protein
MLAPCCSCPRQRCVSIRTFVPVKQVICAPELLLASAEVWGATRRCLTLKSATCVLILLYMCPHTTIYVSSYNYMCPHATICVSSYDCMCPHTTVCVLNYCMCPDTIICVLIPLYVSSYYYICVLILLYVSSCCICVSSYYYMCADAASSCNTN